MISSDLQKEIPSEEWVAILSEDEVLEGVLEEQISVDSKIFFLNLAGLERGISHLSSISEIYSEGEEVKILDREHREKNQRKKSRISM